MASKNEGYTPNHPPYFNGSNYTYWKARMILYIRPIKTSVWSLVVNGYKVPKDKTKAKWDANKQKANSLNYKALNVIVHAQSLEEFSRVSSLHTAKEVWDLLEVTHEGTNLIKKSKL